MDEAKKRERRLFELSKGQPRVALVFPNVYQLAVSNLGYLWVWKLFNERELGCERFVLPSQDILKRSNAAEYLRSLESGERINRFPLIAFSLPYENDYVRVLRILSLSGIPLFSRKRSKSDPIVFAGGTAITANPAPLSEIFDFIVLGEIEPILDELCETLKTYRSQNRLNFLKKVSEISGIYVPRVHGAPEEICDQLKIDVQKSTSQKFSYSPLLAQDDIFGGAFLVEVGRGCPSLCRFCLIGHLGLPPRYADPQEMLNIIENSGAKRVGLLASDVCGHSQFNSLLADLLKRNLEVSVSSLRMGTDADFSLLARAGLRQITLAPEAGSPRIRSVINKFFDDDQIISECERAFSCGIERIKLYFLVGLPTESNDDALKIATLVEKMRTALVKGKKLIVSISPYVPKPHTPFELVPFAGEREIKEKLNLLRARLTKIANVDLEFDSPKEAKWQAYISRAGSEAKNVLVASAQSGKNIEQAAQELGIDIDKEVSRERVADEKHPWKFVNTRVREDFLIEQYHLALESKSGHKCKIGKCFVCGVCRSTSLVEKFLKIGNNRGGIA